MEITELQKEEIKKLIRVNEKIAAIKLIKRRYNLSLKEAAILVSVIDKQVAHRKPVHKVKLNPIASTFPKIVGGIFAMLGIVFLIIAFNSLIKDREITDQSDIIKGVVIENPSQPVIQYEYEGLSGTLQAQINTSPPVFTIGEEVELFISRSNPMDVRINSFTDRFFICIFFGAMGLVFTGVGSAVFFKFKAYGH